MLSTKKGKHFSGEEKIDHTINLALPNERPLVGMGVKLAPSLLSKGAFHYAILSLRIVAAFLGSYFMPFLVSVGLPSHHLSFL